MEFAKYLISNTTGKCSRTYICFIYACIYFGENKTGLSIQSLTHAYICSNQFLLGIYVFITWIMTSFVNSFLFILPTYFNQLPSFCLSPYLLSFPWIVGRDSNQTLITIRICFHPNALIAHWFEDQKNKK